MSQYCSQSADLACAFELPSCTAVHFSIPRPHEALSLQNIHGALTEDRTRARRRKKQRIESYMSVGLLGQTLAQWMTQAGAMTATLKFRLDLDGPWAKQ